MSPRACRVSARGPPAVVDQNEILRIDGERLPPALEFPAVDVAHLRPATADALVSRDVLRHLGPAVRLEVVRRAEYPPAQRARHPHRHPVAFDVLPDAHATAVIGTYEAPAVIFHGDLHPHAWVLAAKALHQQGQRAARLRAHRQRLIERLGDGPRGQTHAPEQALAGLGQRSAGETAALQAAAPGRAPPGSPRPGSRRARSRPCGNCRNGQRP